MTAVRYKKVMPSYAIYTFRIVTLLPSICTNKPGVAQNQTALISINFCRHSKFRSEPKVCIALKVTTFTEGKINRDTNGRMLT